jgi:hypothetical protein
MSRSHHQPAAFLLSSVARAGVLNGFSEIICSYQHMTGMTKEE